MGRRVTFCCKMPGSPRTLPLLGPVAAALSSVALRHFLSAPVWHCQGYCDRPPTSQKKGRFGPIWQILSTTTWLGMRAVTQAETVAIAMSSTLSRLHDLKPSAGIRHLIVRRVPKVSTSACLSITWDSPASSDSTFLCSKVFDSDKRYIWLVSWGRLGRILWHGSEAS